MDTLRGISCIAVVIFHLNEPIPFQNNFYQSFAKFGWMGVPVFFIVSGYCIQLAAARSNSALSFFGKRFFRIYPPYIFSIILVLSVCAIKKLTIGVNDVTVLPSSFPAWIATILLMTNPASSIPTINWVYWTLTYEVIFYLIVSISLLNKRMRLPTLYIFAFLSVIPGSEHYFFVLNQFSFFSLGASLNELNRGNRAESISLFILSILGILLKQPPVSLVVASLSYFSILFSLNDSEKKITRENWFSQVGEASYSLYLSHVPIGCYLLLQFRTGLWIEFLPLHIFYDLVVLATCLIAAKILYNLVEKPSMLIAKKI
ncbi:MAG: acyltransferase [Anaerolineae bacterium]|nr:acyltransferase [Gloeobacterales cyanobacterium ES-bin-313]